MFDLFMSKSDPKISMASSYNPYNSFVSNVGQSLAIQMNKLLEPLSIKEMQQSMKKYENFFKTVEAWKNLEQTYLTKLRQIQTGFKDKAFPLDSNKQKNNQQKSSQSSKLGSSQMIDNELINLFQTLITNHKTMSDKITYDISYVNLQTFQSLSKQIKEILIQQKIYLKQLNSVKDQLEKVLHKKLKLKRQKDEELMLKIFMEDGSQEFMMDQKMKKHTKYNEIRKELEEYELKVSESIDEYHRSSENLKKNHLEYYEKVDRLTECKYETVIKMQLHLLMYYKNMAEGINGMSKEIQVFMDQSADYIDKSPGKQPKNKAIFEEMEKKNRQNKIRIEENRRSQFEILEKLQEKSLGYVEYSLKIIEKKQFEELLTYSRDKDIKTKIKRMIDSNETNPEDTDETCRQIQLIKKIIRSDADEDSLLNVFKNMVAKNSKLRMNFIFLLQFFRINGKFQLTVNQFKPIYKLINIFIEACHQNRDCFVLKQLMILLTTYFVTLEQSIKSTEKQQIVLEQYRHCSSLIEEKTLSPESPVELGEIQKPMKKSSISSNSTKQKIYILQFFKDYQLWRDLEFWESVLIECIYSEKRNTIKNLVRGIESTQKKEMLEAEKTSILNQILYVVRNMIIFDFTQKDVKNFGLRFCKLLKLDDKSIKDVCKTVQEAEKQEVQSMQNQSIEKYLDKILK